MKCFHCDNWKKAVFNRRDNCPYCRGTANIIFPPAAAELELPKPEPMFTNAVAREPLAA